MLAKQVDRNQWHDDWQKQVQNHKKPSRHYSDLTWSKDVEVLFCSFRVRAKLISSKPTKVVLTCVTKRWLLVSITPYLHHCFATRTPSCLVLINAPTTLSFFASLVWVPFLVAKHAKLMASPTNSYLRLIICIVACVHRISAVADGTPLHVLAFVDLPNLLYFAVFRFHFRSKQPVLECRKDNRFTFWASWSVIPF